MIDLKKIKKNILDNCSRCNRNNLSLFNGCCADIIVLFEFYEISFDKEVQFCLEDKIIFLLRNLRKVTSFNFYKGYTGILFTLAYVSKSKIIQLDDDFFSKFDSYLEKYIDFFTESKNYDLLFGLIGIGVYYIELSKLYSSKKKVVYSIIDRLISMSIKKGGTIYWEYTSENTKEEEIINLGMLHGMPSIISFFSICVVEGYQSEKLKETLELAYKSILLFRPQNKIYSYPHFCRYRDDVLLYSPNDTELFYCYGDLGVFNVVRFVSSLLKTNSMENNSILKKIETRLLNGYEYKRECICHGWASLFFFITKNDDILINDVVEKYETYIRNKLMCFLDNENLNPGILSGYHGVILSLLYSMKKNSIERILLLG